MNLKSRVKLLVNRLLVRGIVAIKVDEGTEMTDPAVWITESIYIQLGDDYTVVFRSRPSGLASYDCQFKIEDIISKLKQAIDEGK